MLAPDELKDSEEVAFEFQVTPMDNETPYSSSYIQQFTFSYMTQCTGVGCLVQELVDPEPQTIAFYVAILAIVIYARGRQGGQEDDLYEDEEMLGEKEAPDAFAEGEETPPEEDEPLEDEDDDVELIGMLDEL